MTDKEIIKLWNQGLSKNKLAVIYKRRFNERVKLIRLEMHNRHAGRYITEFEALRYIENLIYDYIIRRNK